jgi:hypothetical protein
MSLPSREANTFALPRGSSNYRTPEDFKAALDARYHFDDWDPCPVNPEGIRTLDGLGETPGWVKSYFYNPPYNDVKPWLEKSIKDKKRGVLNCALLRVDCSTNWMHDLVFPYARPIWVRGRLRFNGKPSPFASVVAAYEPGAVFPAQSVMWQDSRGWHILEASATTTP